VATCPLRRTPSLRQSLTETSESLALEENRGVALGQQGAEAETRDFVALKASR
jgi:hypothetical protein